MARADAVELKPSAAAKPIPFKLDTLDGPRVDLADLRGRVVLVHFFATWCEPCVEEMAALERLAVRSHDAPLRIVAVDVGEVDARVRTFFAEHPVSFPVLLDRDRSAMKSWAVQALPSTFVLDRDLTPILAAEGDVAWDEPEINATLTALMEQQPAERDSHQQSGRRMNDVHPS